MLLVVLAGAIVVQGIAANITNVYTAGLSLVNAVPPLGRFRATLLVAAAAVGLSRVPQTSSSRRRTGSSTSATSAPRSPA